MKIGILYPRSTAHPGMMMDFMDGIKTLLKKQQLTDHIQLLTESIGFGGNEKEVYEKTEKLLVLDDAAILVAYIDLRALEIIKPLVYATGKLVLVVNPGANYPTNWVPQANMLYLTLQHGFLCWLTGRLASRASNDRALLATSFYDCGYLHSAAIVKSFVKSGGKITFNYVNNQRYDDGFEIKQLTDYLSSDKDTTTLLCVLDSLPASLFYSRLNSYADGADLHLFVSPMMLEQQAIEKVTADSKFTVEGYTSWLPSLENNANKEFMDQYFQQSKRTPTAFSLLGWETGLVLQQVLLLGISNYTDGGEIAGRLANIKINSPRGEMKTDPETNQFIAPAYQCTVQPGTGISVTHCIENPNKEWADFIATPSENVSSGWTNTYLCY